MKKLQILVVEDESLVAKDIVNMVRGLGYSVPAVVSTGEEAIVIAEKTRPDIILMDIVLKGQIDGIEAAQHIWENFSIPVVYLTAYADEATLQRAKVTEPFGYILKPFDERELQTTIEMAFFKAQMEKKLRERERWLSTILRSIGDGVIVTDQGGGVTFMNGVAESLTGWNQAEVLEKPLNGDHPNPDPGQTGRRAEPHRNHHRRKRPDDAGRSVHPHRTIVLPHPRRKGGIVRPGPCLPRYPSPESGRGGASAKLRPPSESPGRVHPGDRPDHRDAGPLHGRPPAPGQQAVRGHRR